MQKSKNQIKNSKSVILNLFQDLWKMPKQVLHDNNAQSIVELLITIGLSAILLPVLVAGMISSRQARPQQEQRLQAVGYLREAQEAVRVARDGGWSNIATDGTYHPVITNGTWTLANGSEFINGFGFTRQVIISDVYRDSSGNIVTAGGTLDPSTKKIVTTVSWSNPFSANVSATSYFMRYANLSFIRTTQNDFLQGATTSGKLAITSGGGGEITLGAGSGAGSDWCAPGNSVLAKADLPGNGVVQSVSATSSSTLDYVYSTTGDNASGDSVDASTVDHSPTPTIVSNPPLASNNEAKAYGIYIDHAGGYVYFNENRPPNHTVRIASYNTLANLGYYDASGGGTGNSVYISNNIGYTIVGNKLYTFNTSSINGSSSQAELGSVSLAANGNKVVAVKDPSTGTVYAYVAEASSTKQLEIFQINSNGSIVSPAVASLQLSNAQQGQDIFVNSTGTRVYLVTNSYSSGQKQFFIINTSSKSGALPTPVIGSTYSTSPSGGMSPKGVTVVSGNRAIIVGSGGQQYEVLNIANENSIQYCGGMTLSGANINAISSIYRNDQTAYSYILTTDASNELQIIQGGNGVAFTFNGNYESNTFTATTDAMFNMFTTTAVTPGQTNLQFQVGIKHAVNNSCSSVSFASSDFVGPDGTSSTYFPSSGGILPASTDGAGYENPGQCLRYRAYFSSPDIQQTPELYDVTFNYSP